MVVESSDMPLQQIERALHLLYSVLDDAEQLALGRAARLRVVAAIGELEDARAKATNGTRSRPPGSEGQGGVTPVD
jgi:hypothetical protein